MFGPNKMKAMDGVLGAMMRQRGDDQVFCPALQLALWYRPLVSERKEERGIERKDFDEAGSKSKESETVELWQLF